MLLPRKNEARDDHVQCGFNTMCTHMRFTYFLNFCYILKELRPNTMSYIHLTTSGIPISLQIRRILVN